MSTSCALPKKRLRELSGEDVHDLNVSTPSHDKRNEPLKIDIPATPEINALLSEQVSSLADAQSAASACSATASVKGSPTSLFSAASVNSLFDQVPLIPHSRFATPPALPSTTVSINGLTASATSELESSFEDAQSVSSATSLPALLTAPPIQGLYFDPSLCLPQQVAKSVMTFCSDTYFRRPGVNQVMLFGRAPSSGDSSSQVHSQNGESTLLDMDVGKCTRTDSNNTSSSSSSSVGGPTGLPTVLIDLLSTLSDLLRPFLPEPTHTLLFPPTPTRARQAIINLYHPGEGITCHIDLLKRYGDGIIGVSLGSGCVMRFDRVEEGDHHCHQDEPRDERQEGQRNRWDLYLPERSVLVLSEAARYEWTHGIDKRTRDYVLLGGGGAAEDEYEEEEVDRMCLDDDDDDACSQRNRLCMADSRWIERDVRLSVTFRWLLPGADVVGPPGSD